MKQKAIIVVEESLLKKLAHLTNENFHSEAAVKFGKLVASGLKSLGEKTDLEKAKISLEQLQGVKKRHKQRGHLISEDGDIRWQNMQILYSLLSKHFANADEIWKAF